MNTSNKGIQHIVMADDDEDDYEFFKAAADKGCNEIKISHAANWMELLRYLDKQPLPDVVFLDLNMPVKNGLECLKEIRAEKRYDDVSVIIYSTSSAKKDIEETYRHKANYYIVKPDKYEDITRIVEMICAMEHKILLAQPDKANYVINS